MIIEFVDFKIDRDYDTGYYKVYSNGSTLAELIENAYILDANESNMVNLHGTTIDKASDELIEKAISVIYKEWIK